VHELGVGDRQLDNLPRDLRRHRRDIGAHRAVAGLWRRHRQKLTDLAATTEKDRLSPARAQSPQALANFDQARSTYVSSDYVGASPRQSHGRSAPDPPSGTGHERRDLPYAECLRHHHLLSVRSQSHVTIWIQ
jgi:hypothetical protein